MNMVTLDEEALTVLGIYARASNGVPQKIGDLWRRFHALGNAAAIDARHNDVVYSVYCEYEGDFTGEYTVVIGCSVDADATVPEGMKKIAIPAGKFAVIEPTGEPPMSIWETWSQIWNSPLDRLYHIDYDKYRTDGKLSVHVGVR